MPPWIWIDLSVTQLPISLANSFAIEASFVNSRPASRSIAAW